MISITHNNIPNNGFKSEIDTFVEDLRLSDSLDDKIHQRYKSIGEWLNRQGSLIKLYDPVIYPQGSVRTGTAIKPLSGGAYDVDLVCELKIDCNSISPSVLKDMVGNEIKQYMKRYPFEEKIKNSKKCWTVEYSDNVSFHVDILPAIKKHQNESTDICITNKELAGYETIPGAWEDSNPKGFSSWLKQQEFKVFSDLESNLKLTKKLEKIPEHKVFTPLRKTIMLLKRHRDVFFQGNDGLKPASVIITTLAGHFYAENPLLSTEDTLRSIVQKLHNYVLNLKKSQHYVLPSPSSSTENFLDKWNSNKEYIVCFEFWIEKLVGDITDINCFLNSCKDTECLNEEELNDFLLSQNHVVKKFFTELNSSIKCEISQAENLSYSPQVGGKKFIKNKDIVDKKIEIKFTVNTNIHKNENFKVYWRVINTGLEAARSKSLRGDIFCDDDNPKEITRQETTGYSGIHSIEAFIVQNNKVVSKSAPFIIKIN